MMHTVHMILLLMFLIFSTLANGNEAKKGKKCKCKFELNLLTKLIENIEEDVTMLKVIYPYSFKFSLLFLERSIFQNFWKVAQIFCFLT